MLTIVDLSESKEMDRGEMADIVGGLTYQQNRRRKYYDIDVGARYKAEAWEPRRIYGALFDDIA